MAYLMEDEILTYCQTVPGVSMVEVTIASELINGYKGRSYEPKEITETVQINKRMRGKLKASPIIAIEKVMGIGRGMFGLTQEELSPLDIILDSEGDGYFTYVGGGGLNSLVLGNNPTTLVITYKTGYETYPENLKLACALLAQNIRQRNSFAGEKNIISLDYRVEMCDDSFFTQDIKMLLRNLQ